MQMGSTCQFWCLLKSAAYFDGGTMGGIAFAGNLPGCTSPEQALMDRSKEGIMVHNRNASIDSWRGIAICMVLLLHAYAVTPELAGSGWYETLFHNLGFGVQLFFLLSGLLISESWDRSKDARQFFLKRAAKILPLYLIFLHLGIATFVLASGLAPTTDFFRNGITESNLTLQNYLLHLTFMQTLAPRYMHSLLDGSWSIAHEVWFYAVYPLLRRFVVTSLNSAVVFWIFTILLQAFLADPAYSWATTEGYPPYVQYYFFGNLPCFALGIVLYWWRRGERPDQLFTACGLVGIFLTVALVERQQVQAHNLFLLAIAPLVLSGRFNGSVGGFFQWCGRQTYSLYFVHLFLLIWTHNLIIAPLGIAVMPAFLLNIFVAFPGSFLLSWFVFNPIDRKLLRALVRRYAGDRA
jgi:peptidoglycan/LPS O-acetylase OafA/YrhL